MSRCTNWKQYLDILHGKRKLDTSPFVPAKAPKIPRASDKRK